MKKNAKEKLFLINDIKKLGITKNSLHSFFLLILHHSFFLKEIKNKVFFLNTKEQSYSLLNMGLNNPLFFILTILFFWVPFLFVLLVFQNGHQSDPKNVFVTNIYILRIKITKIFY